ncbi:glycoprotein endo-alpha-1,2-mannosidase-like [Lineus longissimus]|uniref:glycoprotein endo-alpha-1,2-mannosidase-like n=1 Tax=Lineus longissimus TaxID=88925 RepID=UPI00315DADF5
MNSFFRRRMLLCSLKFYGVRRLYFFTIFIFVSSLIVFGLIGYHKPFHQKKIHSDKQQREQRKTGTISGVVNLPQNNGQQKPTVETSDQNSTKRLPNSPDQLHILSSDVLKLMRTTKPNYNIHTFYYPWYGNPKYDKVYLHWGHVYEQHWNALYAKQWPSGRHSPPEDIGSNFYPTLGTYSSRDKAVLESHMRQIRAAGIGVVVVSWLPANSNDGEGKSWNHVMMILLDTAHKYSLKIAFHLEPYKHRSIFSIQHNLKYIFKTYGHHPALYKHQHNGKILPMMYVYDSYEITLDRWQYLLRPGERYSIRGSEIDAFFIGLLVKASHRRELLESGFDGFYSYFASVGFSYGASPQNWGSLSAFARQKNLMFIPSVGPGYDDTRIRPWNFQNKKSRNNGTYYEKNFKLAMKAKTGIISITSFNEWHEGTQLEMASPHDIRNSYDDVIYSYEDYEPYPPDYYITLTNKLVKQFSDKRPSSNSKPLKGL